MTASSSVMVIFAWLFERMPFTGLVKLMKNVSVSSGRLSRRSARVKVFDVSPGLKVSVPEVAT